MSLNINDLGLQDTIRSIINDLNSGEVYIARRIAAPDGQNPFDTTNPKALPELVGVFDFISFKDGTTKYNEETGIREGGYFSMKMGTPVPYIAVDDLCYVDFSEGQKLAVGTVDQVSIGISSIVELRVKAVEVLPFTFDEIRALVP